MVNILSAAVFFFIELLAAAMENRKDDKKAGGSNINFFSIAGDFMTLDKSLNHSDPYLSYL